MQISIARQLNLQASTVGNFFMNARRRLQDKYDTGQLQPSPPASPPPTASAATAAANSQFDGHSQRAAQLEETVAAQARRSQQDAHEVDEVSAAEDSQDLHQQLLDMQEEQQHILSYQQLGVVAAVGPDGLQLADEDQHQHHLHHHLTPIVQGSEDASGGGGGNDQFDSSAAGSGLHSHHHHPQYSLTSL